MRLDSKYNFFFLQNDILCIENYFNIDNQSKESKVGIMKKNRQKIEGRDFLLIYLSPTYFSSVSFVLFLAR
jgi:hypothetical protein